MDGEKPTNYKDFGLDSDAIAWFKDKCITVDRFYELKKIAEKHGYTLMQNGLFYRYPNSQENIKRYGRTVVDVLYTRPTGEHEHETGELISIIKGEGILYIGNESIPVHEITGPEYINRFIEAGTVHSVNPEIIDSANGKIFWIEARLLYMNIIDPEEIQ